MRGCVDIIIYKIGCVANIKLMFGGKRDPWCEIFKSNYGHDVDRLDKLEALALLT